MPIISETEAQANLGRLIDDAAQSHCPIVITGANHRAVLLSEEDWSSIQETLHLLSVPGMRESLLKGAGTPLNECIEEVVW